MIVPFKLSEHLVHYFFKELKGKEKKYAGLEVKVIPIEKHSFIGKLIVSHIKKIDYPVKNIKDFNLFIEMKTSNRLKYCTKQKLFKRENLSTSFVEIPEELMTEIDSQLDEIFRQNFYFYVLGKTEGKEDKIKTVIRKWMDDYNLWNFNFDIEMMRRLFYRMRDDGPMHRLQTRDISYFKIQNKSLSQFPNT